MNKLGLIIYICINMLVSSCAVATKDNRYISCNDFYIEMYEKCMTKICSEYVFYKDCRKEHASDIMACMGISVHDECTRKD